MVWFKPYGKWASSLEPFGSHLEKMLSHNYDCSGSTGCTGVAFTLAQALTKCHPLHSVHRFHLPYNNLMPTPGGLILASSSFSLFLCLRVLYL